MDTRLIILAVSFALVVAALIYLVFAFARSRRTRGPYHETVANWPALDHIAPEASQATAESEEDPMFAEPSGGITAVVRRPLRTGAWQPEPPSEDSLPRTSRVDDYWDTLIAEEELLIRSSAAQYAAPMTAKTGDVESGEAEPDLRPESRPEAEPGPEAETEPVPETPPAPVDPPSPPASDRPRVVVPVVPTPPAPSPPRPSASPQRAASTEPRPPITVHDPAPSEPEHELVAPVELWFGDHRVGVRHGSKTYDQFQKIARVLFEDLGRAKAGRS